MKNFNSPMEETDLDNLLRQLVLDGGNDEFTQNTLTMNADFIFKSAVNATPNASREMVLVQKLEQAFIKPRGFGKFWLNGIVLVLLLGGSFAIYKLNSGTEQLTRFQMWILFTKKKFPRIINITQRRMITCQLKMIGIPEIILLMFPDLFSQRKLLLKISNRHKKIGILTMHIPQARCLFSNKIRFQLPIIRENLSKADWQICSISTSENMQ